MKKLILNLGIILSICAQSYAAIDLNDSKEIRSRVLETEKYIETTIIHDLKQSTGLNNLSIDIKVNIDFKLLEKVLGSNPKEIKKFNSYDLPGLFVEGKEAEGIQLLRSAQKEDIIQSITGVEAKLIYHESNFNQQNLERHFKRVLKHDLPSLKENLIKMAVTFEEPAGKNIEDSFKQELISVLSVFKKSLASMTEKSEFMKAWNKYYQQIAIFLSVLAVGGLIYLFFVLQSGFSKISRTIQDKNFTVNSTGGAQRAQAPQEQQRAQRLSSSGENTFERYIDALEHLKSSAKENPKIFGELTVVTSIIEDYDRFLVLMDVLPQSKKDELLSKMDEKKRHNFKQFLIYEAQLTYQDDDKLKEMAIDIIKLMKIAQLDNNEFYKIMFKNQIELLDIYEFSKFMPECSQKETGYVLDLADPVKISYAIGQGQLDPARLIVNDAEPLSKDEITKIMIKASRAKAARKTPEQKDRINQIIAHLDAKNGQKIATTIGLDSKYHFENMFNNFQEDALQYLKGLNFDDLKALMPMLSQKMVEAAYSSLPDLLVERLRSQKFFVTPEGINLKGEFYYFLKDLETSETQDSSSNETKEEDEDSNVLNIAS